VWRLEKRSFAPRGCDDARRVPLAVVKKNLLDAAALVAAADCP
jgi:hypothetical protein